MVYCWCAAGVNGIRVLWAKRSKQDCTHETANVSKPHLCWEKVSSFWQRCLFDSSFKSSDLPVQNGHFIVFKRVPCPSGAGELYHPFVEEFINNRGLFTLDTTLFCFCFALVDQFLYQKIVWFIWTGMAYLFKIFLGSLSLSVWMLFLCCSLLSWAQSWSFHLLISGQKWRMYSDMSPRCTFIVRLPWRAQTCNNMTCMTWNLHRLLSFWRIKRTRGWKILLYRMKTFDSRFK